MTEHFTMTTTWTGNRGTGTSDYRAYGRDHESSAPGKSAVIPGSAVHKYRGDKNRYNPEELLIGALSACHMLWFLHLCADAGIVVTSYRDDAEGTIELDSNESGKFREVILHPLVEIADEARATELDNLHHRAHELCFIARSVNFPVRTQPPVRR